MAIARDAATDGGNNGVAGPSHSFAHTCTGSDRYLEVVVVGDIGGGADDITGVTYNGVAMTQLRKEAGATIARMTYVYSLVGPASGTHNVVISAGSTHFIAGAARSYTGVSQTGQPEVSNVTFSNADADSSLTTSITPLTANSWVLLTTGGYDSNNLPTAGTGANLWSRDTSFGLWGFFDSNAAVPATSQSMAWTYAGSTPDMLSVMTVIAPVGGDTTPPTLSSLAINTAGDELTATLSEAGCTPASGTGGFSLAGTAATVASWAISGTTLTLTLSGVVYSGATVTLSYDDATASEAIADAADNLLADITDASVTNNSTQIAPSPSGGSMFRSAVISRGRIL